MKFFQIKNYEKYQAKKRDRNAMPWIMLHKKLMNDWSYGQLRVSEKLMFIHMLLIADSVSNRFPVDPKWMRTKLQVEAQWIFANFESKGLIEIIGAKKSEQCPSIREDINLEDINLERDNTAPVRSNYEDVNRDPRPKNKLDVSPCLIHYQIEYQRLFQKIPMFSELKATAALLPVVKQFGEGETNILLTKYLECDNDFVAKKGYPIYLFPDSINALQVALPPDHPRMFWGNNGKPCSQAHADEMMKICEEAERSETH